MDNVRVAGDDDRGSVAAGTVLSKEVEDKGFLVDTARSQLRQFVEARSGYMAVELVDSSLWL